MMRRPAGFDADPRRRQLLKELNNLPPPQLLAQHRLLGRIHTMQLKNTLGRVHSNADKIVHGRPPCLRSTTTSFWHIDAVGGRPPQQPLAFKSEKRPLLQCSKESPRRMGPGLRRDDESGSSPSRGRRGSCDYAAIKSCGANVSSAKSSSQNSPWPSKVKKGLAPVLKRESSPYGSRPSPGRRERVLAFAGT